MAFPDEIITESELGSSVRTKVNRGLSTQGLACAASGLAGSTSIPDGAWTKVSPTVFLPGNTGASMTTGTITVPEAADGAWIVTFGMQWKNDQGGLTKHRRKLRLMNGIYPLAEIPEVLFDPAMGDLTENSAHNGVASIKLPGLGGRVVHMEAWQNSGIAVNIVTSSIRMVRLGDAQ